MKLRPTKNERVYEQFFKICTTSGLGPKVFDAEDVISECYKLGFPQLRRAIETRGYYNFVQDYWRSFTWIAEEMRLEKAHGQRNETDISPEIVYAKD